MKKHKAKLHPVAETVTSLEDSQPTGTGTSEAESRPGSAKNAEDWDNDPDVELDLAVLDSFESSDEDDGQKSVEETKIPTIKVTEELKMDQELTLGCTERKHTNLYPVKAPIKMKDKETVVENRPKRKLISNELNVSGESKVREVQDTMDSAVQVSLPKCEHCRIHFEDEILFATHRGWHNVTDPFQCNMCGKLFNNRHEFYFHLGRYYTK